jgi:multiple sugar transport system ATP-binding protein
MAKLVLSKVRKNFEEVNVIKEIDLDIKSGEFCVFVGPSGCGKSTLLRMISGLESTSSGTIAIDEKVVNDIPAAQRGLAMVFQSYALYPHMSVRSNLSFGLENLNTPKEEINERVSEAAKMLQIEQLLDRKPGQLSGGQRQRVAIGRAVVREPKIFLFDEPLSNLDAELRVAMRREIASLHRRLKNTMIYVTHDQIEAMTMADKIAVIRDGRVEQYGTPLELFNKPANRFVAGFIGSPAMNFIDVIATSNGLELDGGNTLIGSAFSKDVVLGSRLELGVRPEDLTIDDNGSISLNVTETEQLGSECYIFGNMINGQPLVVRMMGQFEVRANSSINLAFNLEKAHLFDKESGAVCSGQVKLATV